VSCALSIALPLRGLITGAGIGAAQYLLLRGVMSRAPVWARIVALSWAIGWMITRAAGIDLALQWSVYGSSEALIFQRSSLFVILMSCSCERMSGIA
jgi:hypothetical protein